MILCEMSLEYDGAVADDETKSAQRMWGDKSWNFEDREKIVSAKQ